ncbi:hypothetical protein BH09CHL1_BH09CHL1_06280 [soil metagenome]
MNVWIKAKKIILSLSVIVLFALYALQKQAQLDSGAPIVAALPPTSAATIVVQPTEPSATIPSRTDSESESDDEDEDEDDDEENSGDTFQNPKLTIQRPQTSSSTATATAASTATAMGAFVDGTYTGSQADAHWGTVQVVVTIIDGTVSDVQFADYPNHRSRSRTINNHAMPILTQEAIQSQQASVDIVSGATDTSEAFIQSLASALSQATK